MGKIGTLCVVGCFALAATLHAQSRALAPTGTLRAYFIATNPVQGRVDAKTGETSGPAADLTRELGASRVPHETKVQWKAGRARTSLN